MVTTASRITVRKGTDKTEPFKVYNGDPADAKFLDITSDTLTLTVNNSSGTAILTLTSTAGDITVTNGPGGAGEILYSATDISGLTVAGDHYRYLSVVHDGSTRVVMEGGFAVLGAI